MARWCRRIRAARSNWPPPSFSPETGLFYVNATRAYSVYYIYDDDDKPEGWGGNDRGGYSEVDAAGDRLQDRQDSLEPQVARQRWRRSFGLAEHCGKFALCGRYEFESGALDPATGNPLWHAGLHRPLTNGPITYELDGTQYLVVAAGDTLYAFAIR